MRGVPPITPGKNPYLREPPRKLQTPWPQSSDPTTNAMLKAGGRVHLAAIAFVAQVALVVIMVPARVS